MHTTQQTHNPTTHDGDAVDWQALYVALREDVQRRHDRASDWSQETGDSNAHAARVLSGILARDDDRKRS